MRRPHIRLTSNRTQQTDCDSTPDQNDTTIDPAPDNTGKELLIDSAHRANTDSPQRTVPQSDEERLEQIRRNIAEGVYLTREAAEEAARRLMESEDL